MAKVDASNFPSTPTPFQIPFYGILLIDNYQQLDKLGEGTFGTVTKCVLRSPGNKGRRLLVALKKITIHDTKAGFPITAFREVTILKQLRHKNILPLLDVVAQKDDRMANILGLGNIHHTFCNFFLVTPYMSLDLSGLLHNPDIRFNESIIKCLMLQLLEGLDYLHHQKYYHRDIKAANLLLDLRGCLKIADFGLARKYYGHSPKPGGGPSEVKAPYTAIVVTRWYRAPELLLGDQYYTTAIDMWGVGCIFGEFFEHSPILKGASDLEQAYKIFDLVGEPNNLSYPGYQKLRNPMKVTITPRRPTLADRFLRHFETAESRKHGLDLLTGLLTLNPMTRLNASQALKHPYFSSLPIPYRPEELPAFKPSHEIDNKRFKEERERRAHLDAVKNAPRASDSGRKPDWHSERWDRSRGPPRAPSSAPGARGPSTPGYGRPRSNMNTPNGRGPRRDGSFSSSRGDHRRSYERPPRNRNDRPASGSGSVFMASRGKPRKVAPWQTEAREGGQKRPLSDPVSGENKRVKTSNNQERESNPTTDSKPEQKPEPGQ